MRCPSKNLMSALLIISVAILGLAAPGPVLAEEKPLVIGVRGDAVTMDPHGRSETTNVMITAHIYARLVQLDHNIKVQPMLAKSWEIKGNSIIFKLRKGLKFNNGEPFNAAAAKYSIERAAKHPTSQMKHYVTDYSAINVLDDYTLEYVTKKHEPEALQRFEGIAMVPPKYFKKHDDAYLALNPQGLGPYKFVKWVKDEKIELVRNDDWYEKPAFKRLVFKPIPESATRLAALLSGEIDICDAVAIQDIPRIEKNKSTYVKRAPSLRVIYLMFDVHCDKGGPAPEMQPGLPKGAPNPFKNPKVRQAVAHAINVDELIKYVMEGSGYPATELVPTFAQGFNPAIKRAKHDPALAKKLLKEAGFPNGFEANFDAPNDRYINDREMAEAISGQLQKVGIKLNTITQPKAVFFPKVKAYKSPMFLAGWSDESWVATMNRFFRVKTKKCGRNNRGRLNRPDLEKKLDQAELEPDMAKRIKMRQAVGAEFYALNYILPLYYQENVVGFSNRVAGDLRGDEQFHCWDLIKKK